MILLYICNKEVTSFIMFENLLPWLGSAFIVALAASLQGITGFGFALVSMPLLLLIYDPHHVVIINAIISIATLSSLTFKVRQQVLVPVVKNLFMGSILGIPLGAYVFFSSDVHLLKLIIGLVTGIFSLILISGATAKNVAGRIWEATAGSVSGFLTSSVGMPGPPVILFLSNQKLPKEHFRATTAAYFILAYLCSLSLLIYLGGVDQNTVFTALSLIPLAVLGGHLGYLIFPRVSQPKFQQGVSLLVFSTSVYAVVTSLVSQS